MWGSLLKQSLDSAIEGLLCGMQNYQSCFQQEFAAEGLSYLWRIGISRFSIRISSLRALRLEREKRVGGEYVTTISIITAKALI